MKLKDRMIPVIVLHVLLFLFSQSAFMLLIFWYYKIPHEWLIRFFLISVPLHAGLAGFLITLRSSFYFLTNRRPMKTLGIANRITMFRISATPTIMILIMLFPIETKLFAWISVLTFLAFISDLLDGWISRSLSETSKIGQYLDSSSDYIVLLMIGAVLSWHKFIDWWFFSVILIRYIIQWIMVGVLFFRGNRGDEVKATFLGKASVFGTMTVMGISLAPLIPWFETARNNIQSLRRVLSIACSLLLVVSLIEKIQVFTLGLARPLGIADHRSPKN